MIGKGLFDSNTYCCKDKVRDEELLGDKVAGYNCNKSTTGNCFGSTKFKCDKEYKFTEKNKAKKFIIEGEEGAAKNAGMATDDVKCDYIESTSNKVSRNVSKAASVVGDTIVGTLRPEETTETVRTADGRYITVKGTTSEGSNAILNGINRGIIDRGPGFINTVGNLGKGAAGFALNLIK